MKIEQYLTLFIHILFFQSLSAQEIVQEFLVKNLSSDILVAKYNNIYGDSGAAIYDHKEGNRVLIKGTPETIESAVTQLEFLDVSTQMVNIEYMVVEYFHGDDFDWSFDITNGQFGRLDKIDFTTGAINGFQFAFNGINRLSPQFQMNLTALISENKAKIVTNPHLVVKSGESAALNITETITLFLTQTSQTGFVTQNRVDQTAGIVLEVTPIPSHDSICHLKVHGNISQFLETSIDGEIRVDGKDINTTVDVKDGHTLIIGGIISEQTNDIDGGVPFLKDIPLIGLLFKRKRQVKEYVERVIYITPRIFKARDINIEEQTKMYDEIRGVNPLETQISNTIETGPQIRKFHNTKKAFRKGIFGKNKEKKKKEK